MFQRSYPRSLTKLGATGRGSGATYARLQVSTSPHKPDDWEPCSLRHMSLLTAAETHSPGFLQHQGALRSTQPHEPGLDFSLSPGEHPQRPQA